MSVDFSFFNIFEVEKLDNQFGLPNK